MRNLRDILLAMVLSLCRVHAQSDANGARAAAIAAVNGDKAALAQLRTMASNGDVGAQYAIGTMYSNGLGIAKDSVQAATWYRKAAEQGDAAAQFDLAVMYSQGDGVPRDTAQARVWYTTAAEQGNADAQENLGVMYVKGEGVAGAGGQFLSGWFAKRRTLAATMQQEPL